MVNGVLLNNFFLGDRREYELGDAMSGYPDGDVKVVDGGADHSSLNGDSLRPSLLHRLGADG
jgi:hypothetical protein